MEVIWKVLILLSLLLSVYAVWVGRENTKSIDDLLRIVKLIMKS